ncbi:hypothetical protein H4R19_001762 [Coemansia spiralis]|nr:hypothetical protein H4R19_001762 [Coemansia spiralis]
MQLCNLPEDILVIVLRWCLSNYYVAANRLKRNLPLLSVCQLWRYLATPMVYSHAFVQYGKRPGFEARHVYDPNVEEPADVAVITNLDLVTMVSGASAVKKMNIDVCYQANPFPGWRNIIQKVRTVATTWRVVELNVAMHPGVFSFGDDDENVAKYTDDIAEVGDALAALVPDVRRLDCGGLNLNPIARSLYGRLAAHYADQLQLFKSRHPISEPLDCQFTRLRKVDISYDQVIDYQLPRMASGELVDMSFTHAPPNHSWASFSTDSSLRMIEFTKLKKLDVSYYEVYRDNGVAVRHRDGHPWVLRFPSLESLSISCGQDFCPLLEYAVLPPHMESIYIDVNPATFQQLADVVLPATRRLSLSISRSSGGDPSGLPAINSLLKSARGCESLELEIKDYQLPVVPESITCTALTRLLVSGPTSVDTMLAFIERMPKLRELTFDKLDLSDVQTDISIPEADEDANVEPLSTSLRVLAINYDRERHSPDMAVAVAKYVLLRIPTMTKLIAAQTPKDPVLEFVEAYTPRYPHLDGIVLRLHGDE